MNYLITKIDPDTWDKFKTLCRRRGTRPAAVLREVIEKFVTKYSKQKGGEKNNARRGL